MIEPLQNEKPHPFRVHVNEKSWELGGLRFDVYFSPGRGPCSRVFAKVNGEWNQMFRFDDFPDNPHLHAPADGPDIDFDRTLGEPLAWFVSEVRDHLPDLIRESGFEAVLPDIDLTLASDFAKRIGEEVVACVPEDEGYVRVPGYGLQRIAT